MTHFYEVSYVVFDEDETVFKKGTFGLMHNKECFNTIFKTIIRRTLPIDKKALEIVIPTSELISEEEAKRRFGMNILSVQFKHRMAK